MWRSQHGAPSVNSVIDNEEVVVAGEVMFVNAVKAPLLRGGAESIAGGDEASKLGRNQQEERKTHIQSRAHTQRRKESHYILEVLQNKLPTVFSPWSIFAALMGS
jgi:hypothetical protein